MNQFPQNNHGQPHNAVDLSTLRGPTEQQKAMLRQATRTMFINNGLLCNCGELIRHNGIMMFVYKEGIIDQGRGPEIGAQLLTSHFCGRHCDNFRHEVNRERTQQDGVIVGVRRLPAMDWFHEITFFDEGAEAPDGPEAA